MLNCSVRSNFCPSGKIKAKIHKQKMSNKNCRKYHNKWEKCKWTQMLCTDKCPKCRNAEMHVTAVNLLYIYCILYRDLLVPVEWEHILRLFAAYLKQRKHLHIVHIERSSDVIEGNIPEYFYICSMCNAFVIKPKLFQ